mmetsp:Transcript_93932/g.163131  ORF Transcript_93932/g.163131 Transcript_93932/m.163131 type:complete len:204 (+) Transcript_93932:272-883(+)
MSMQRPGMLRNLSQPRRDAPPHLVVPRHLQLWRPKLRHRWHSPAESRASWRLSAPPDSKQLQPLRRAWHSNPPPESLQSCPKRYLGTVGGLLSKRRARREEEPGRGPSTFPGSPHQASISSTACLRSLGWRSSELCAAKQTGPAWPRALREAFEALWRAEASRCHARSQRWHQPWPKSSKFPLASHRSRGPSAGCGAHLECEK